MWSRKVHLVFMFIILIHIKATLSMRAIGKAVSRNIATNVRTTSTSHSSGSSSASLLNAEVEPIASGSKTPALSTKSAIEAKNVNPPKFEDIELRHMIDLRSDPRFTTALEEAIAEANAQTNSNGHLNPAVHGAYARMRIAMERFATTFLGAATGTLAGKYIGQISDHKQAKITPTEEVSAEENSTEQVTPITIAKATTIDTVISEENTPSSDEEIIIRL